MELSNLKFSDLSVGDILIWTYPNNFDDDSLWEVLFCDGTSIKVKVIHHKRHKIDSVMWVHWPLQFMEIYTSAPTAIKYADICRKIKQMDSRWIKQQQEKGNKPCGVSVAIAN